MGVNTWFISGASSGFGNNIAVEALKRGDNVIATSRKGSTLKDLEAQGALVMDLDATSDDSTIQAIFDKGVARYGEITHFINAPGFVLEGPVESATAGDAFDSFNVNVLAIMNLSRLEVAYLRPRGKGGVIANFGSIASWHGGPGWAHYAAAKWAVSGFTEALHEEVKEFGIRATVIEPGYFRTGFLNKGGANRKYTSVDLSREYAGTKVAAVHDLFENYNNNQPGDVVKGCKVIVDVLTGAGVGTGREIPIRMVLGADAIETIRTKIAQTEKLLSEWKDVIISTDHDDVKKA